MAKILPGVGFGQASGSVAGVTYSHNATGAYMRNRSVPVNPQTTPQTIVRSRLGNLAQAWRTLAQTERNEWISQAANVSLIDSLGQSFAPSGQQYFLQVNMVRLNVGLAQADTPPAAGTAQVITALSATAVGATGVVTATFAPAIGATEYFILEATAPMSAGKAFVGRSKYRQLEILATADVSPYVATTSYSAVFGALTALDVGKAIHLRLTPVDANGFKGVPFSAKVVIS